jgi:hypothetical protein
MTHTNDNDQSRIRRHPFFLMTPLALAFAAALALAAPLAISDTATAAPIRIRVVQPRDHAPVAPNFTVRIRTNVAIGEPDTGRHHIHLYWDGERDEGRYDIVYAKTFRKKGLAPGRHRLDAVIANADHSTTDAHQTLIVTVEKQGAATGNTPTSSPMSSSPAGGNGY